MRTGLILNRKGFVDFLWRAFAVIPRANLLPECHGPDVLHIVILVNDHQRTLFGAGSDPAIWRNQDKEVSRLRAQGWQERLKDVFENGRPVEADDQPME